MKTLNTIPWACLRMDIICFLFIEGVAPAASHRQVIDH